MKTIKLIFTALLLIVAVTNAKAQSKDKFIGVYNLINDQGQNTEQTIKIFNKDDSYYFQAEGAEAYKMTSWEDGKELRITTQESGEINDNGSVEVNLGADVRLFFEKNQLIFEMTVPDIGTDKYILQKR